MGVHDVNNTHNSDAPLWRIYSPGQGWKNVGDGWLHLGRKQCINPYDRQYEFNITSMETEAAYTILNTNPKLKRNRS